MTSHETALKFMNVTGPFAKLWNLLLPENVVIVQSSSNFPGEFKKCPHCIKENSAFGLGKIYWCKLLSLYYSTMLRPIGGSRPSDKGVGVEVRSSRPWDKGGGQKNFGGPFWPYFDLKIREGPSPGFATAATTHLGATRVAVTLAITEALLARVRMSLVWISKPVVSVLKSKLCPCRNFSFVFEIVLVTFAVSTNLYVVCLHFICQCLKFMSLVTILPLQRKRSARTSVK